MINQLKPSMFNYKTYNSSGEMLLYNTFVGCESFTKVKKSDCEKVEQILSNPCIRASNEQSVNSLLDRGFLVDSLKNEKMALKYKAFEFITDNLLHLTIFTTGQCNFRCKYCCEDFKHSQMNEEAQRRIILFIEKNIRRYKGVQIDWFGGEPLLGFEVIKNISQAVIRICNLNRKPYVASITSNGYCLNEATFRELMKLHVLYYTITVDGLEDTHNYFRHLANGKKSFKTIIKNLTDIRSNCKSGLFHFNIRTNFTREMYNDLDAYIDYYSSLFSDPRFSFFIKLAMDWGGSSIQEIYGSLLPEVELPRIYQQLKNANKIKNFDSFRAYYEFGGCVCSAGQLNGFVLDTHANIYKCSRIYCDEIKVGNISNKGDLLLDQPKVYDWLNPYVCSKENFSVCSNEDCVFQPICLFEPCGKRRLVDCDNYVGGTCPSEIKYISCIFELLDLNDQNFKALSC